jgi:hypothetical protein
VPADNGLRLDDEEVVAPARREPADPDPENPIRVPQAGCGVGPEGDLQLVAEDHVLKGDVAPRAEAGKDTTKQEDQKLKHSAG